MAGSEHPAAKETQATEYNLYANRYIRNVLRLAFSQVCVMLSRVLMVTPEKLANLVLLELMARRYVASPKLHPSVVSPAVD